jgi:hypothetical protein
VTEREKRTIPPELAQYDAYTNYPGRAEELLNSSATFGNNAFVAAMACETDAQWRLLARLRGAGLLLHPDDAHLLCVECKRAYDSGCPDCGSCQAGCSGGHKDNPCTHSNAKWAV